MKPSSDTNGGNYLIDIRVRDDSNVDYKDWYNKVLTVPATYFHVNHGEFREIDTQTALRGEYEGYKRILNKDLKTIVKIGHDNYDFKQNDNNDRLPTQFQRSYNSDFNTIDRRRNLDDFVSDDMSPLEIEMLFNNKNM